MPMPIPIPMPHPEIELGENSRVVRAIVQAVPTVVLRLRGHNDLDAGASRNQIAASTSLRPRVDPKVNGSLVAGRPGWLRR